MFAVIDIGSNSVRLLMNGQKTLATTRLGALSGGILSDEAMLNSVDAVNRFAAQARAQGLSPRAFATSAVRDAANRDVFMGMIEARCDLAVDLLSGQREAELAFEGSLPGTPGMHCVMDQGGGSTEITAGRIRPEATVSLALGAVRLMRMFPYGDPPHRHTAAALYRHALEAYAQARTLFPQDMGSVTLTGGTCTTLAALDQGLTSYEPSRVQDHVMSRDMLLSWLERLLSMDTRMRRSLPGMDEPRADIIIAGASSVCAFMEAFGAQTARVSDKDIIDAYYLRLMSAY